MQTKICPQCETTNFAGNRTCKNCQYTFSAASVYGSADAPQTEPVNDAPEPPAVPYSYAPPVVVQTTHKANSVDIANGILWLLLCGFLFIVWMDYVTGSTNDTSAPQQGARAAMSCFYVIIGYCGIRALTEAIRSGRGK